MKRNAALLLVFLLVLQIVLPINAEPSLEPTMQYGGIPEKYLTANENGYELVEWCGDRLHIEKRDKDFVLIDELNFMDDFPVFGGFYSGPKYNFVVMGKENPEHKDAETVLKVIRYTKDWLIDGICEIQTTEADEYSLQVTQVIRCVKDGVSFGSCKMKQVGNYLYITTAGVSYPDEEGTTNPINLYLVIDLTTMIWRPEMSAMTNNMGCGLVSPSMTQLMTVCDDNIVVANLGLAFPRALVLTHFKADAHDGYLCDKKETDNAIEAIAPDEHIVQYIPGELGEYHSGVEITDFVVTDTTYLIAGTCGKDEFSQQDACMWIMNRETQIAQRVKLSEGVDVKGPYLVQTKTDEYVLIWNEGDLLCWCKLDQDGKINGEIKTKEHEMLSDCKPIVSEGKLMWYTRELKPDIEPDPVDPTDVSQEPTDPSESSEPFEPTDPSESSEPTDVSEPSEPTDSSEEPTDPTGEPDPTEPIEEPPEPTPPPKPVYDFSYEDVQETAWFYEYVMYTTQNKLFNGISENEFGPDVKLNRAMVITVLWRMRGSPDIDANIPFTDVKTGSWYEPALRWAYTQGIAMGVEKGKFAPEVNVTREQMVTFLYRYHMKYTAQEGILGFVNRFDDHTKIGSFARPAMEWATYYQIITGMTPNTIVPQGTATRAQFAKILCVYYKIFMEY